MGDVFVVPFRGLEQTFKVIMIEQKDGTTLNLRAFQDIKINAPVGDNSPRFSNAGITQGILDNDWE